MRPSQHLIAMGKKYPKINKVIDDLRQQRGKGLPNWASFCFLPMAGWYAIACQGTPSLETIADMQALASMHTWQYSKGFYQFDSDLYQALIESKIDGDLPSGVLHRLPEWCVYIDTPTLSFDGVPIHGFFAHLEHDANDGHHELRLLLDADNRFISVPLHLGDWSLLTAVDKYLMEAGRQAIKMGRELVTEIDMTDTIAHDIMPFVSLLLYLCSEEPDLSNRAEPDTKPSQARPKKTKQGWRLFPADKVKIWSVGDSLGEQLRHTKSEYKAYQGGHKKAHLRRGHYKTYWTGAKDGERKAVSRWIAPAIVAGDKTAN